MLLAIDTSTCYLGAALYDDIRVQGEITWLSLNHHTVELGPVVKKLFDRTESGIDDLNALAIALGPGSFTGLRIGLAFCKGLALSRNLPIIGIPTLDVLAYGQPVTDVRLAAILEVGRGRIAVAWYHAEAGNWTPSGNLNNLAYETFLNQIQPPATICGEVSRVLADLILDRLEDVHIASPALSLRRPSYLAELAWRRWQKGEVDDPVKIKPIYLHRGEPIPGG